MIGQTFNTNDFDIMKWHDCKLYAMSFNKKSFQFAFDIDYILQWVAPQPEGAYYKFFVSPAVLTFHNVWEIAIDINCDLDLDINNITKSNPQPSKNLSHNLEYDWLIELQQGEISFKAVGFDLVLKQEATLKDRQTLDWKERGGIDFNLPPLLG
jgi:hypothetical protein